jgi:hypothetical protein
LGAAPFWRPQTAGEALGDEISTDPYSVLPELPKAKVLAWKPDNADFVDVTSTGTDGAHYVLENALTLYERDSGLLPVVGVISTVAITVIKACDPIQARLPF